MRSPAKTRRAGALAAILTATFCAAATSAFAQAAGSQDSAPPPVAIENHQTQVGDIFAEQILRVEEAPFGATSAAVAIGNDVSAAGQNQPLNLRSTQSLSGDVTGRADAAVTGYSGPFLGVIGSATGNSGTSATCCAPLTGEATQTVAAGSHISGQAYASAYSAEQISADSTAVGNTQGWLTTNGYSNSTTTQAMRGRVSADTETGACCVGGLVGGSATAVANNVTIENDGGAADAVVRQVVDGQGVSATTLVNQYSAETAAAVSTATANNVSMNVAGGGFSLSNDQSNDSPVSAIATINIGDFLIASTSAYGVGNSAIVTDVGPGGALFNSQVNNGAISANASTNGASGYEAIASASAVGNAVSAYVCATCQGGVSAQNTQINTGPVRGVSSVNTGPSGVIAGQASAVGNHAGFVVKSPGS